MAQPVNAHENWDHILELAACEVFELMLQSKLTSVATRQDVQGVTSMVGLAGKLCGVMSLRCSLKASVVMASKMLGVPPDDIGLQASDAFGEICNMIAGNFKNKISGLDDGCMLSIPTVITGEGYQLHSPGDGKTIEISLLFENMPVNISLQMQS